MFVEAFIAPLSRDFEEARFRSQLAATKAAAAGLTDINLAATGVLVALVTKNRHLGRAMARQCAIAILYLASALETVAFEPLRRPATALRPARADGRHARKRHRPDPI